MEPSALLPETASRPPPWSTPCRRAADGWPSPQGSAESERASGKSVLRGLTRSVPAGSRYPEHRGGATAYAPVLQVRAPGVRLGAWPSMVAVGALVGLAVQAQVAAALGLPVLTLLVLSLVACLIGVVGAKVYYLATHRKEKPGLLMVGMSLQGFVLAALGTVALGSVTLALPLGAALDASAPGLLFGAAIGRIGCFVGGCCAGRPTASR